MNLQKRAKLYPGNLLDKLGFNSIKEHLSQFCASTLGKNEVQRVAVYAHQPTIAILLNQVKEYKSLFADEDVLNPDTSYPDLSKHLDILVKENAVLELEPFVEIRTFLRQWAYLEKLTRKNQERWADLDLLVNKYPYEKSILASIEAIINEKGEIRPEISPELARIRQEIKKTENVQDKKFEAILRKCRQSQWLSAEEQSLRNGRRVLAMYSEFKRQIKGIIHDESSTGKTTFIEPQQLVELGNDLFDLRQQERKEIIRILRELSNEIRPFHQHLSQYQMLAGKVDLVAAKAKLALKLDASFPILVEKPGVTLDHARHPLLQLAFADSKRKVVPLRLDLHKSQRLLMVSGPNAGGKSICLKTVGLLQVMLQAGMLIPTDSHSKMSIFQKIFLDMGDDQSIENDLSTYSSHLKNLKHVVNHANAQTLVLLDEFGTGTDPQFGGAIAEAVLDHLRQKQAMGMATTHYSNLKLYAQKHEGVENASMLFDHENMQPTFQLEIGRPGSSYAFEIAQRIGLNKSIIDYAQKAMGTDVGNYEKLVLQLEREKLQMQQKLQSVQDKENQYKDLLDQYKSLKQELKQNKQKMELQFKTQLQNELKNQNKRFEKQLASLKTSQKSQEEIAREIRATLQKKSGKVEEEVERLEEKMQQQKGHTAMLKPGDAVKMVEGTEVGELQEIQGQDAIVAFNHLKTRIPLNQLERSEAKAKAKTSKGVSVRNYIMEFNSSIDVRGMRTDEALHEIEQLIDHAVVLNHPRVRILHGRGNGILKKYITEFLRGNQEVRDFENEHADHGGDGITIVHLS